MRGDNLQLRQERSGSDPHAWDYPHHGGDAVHGVHLEKFGGLVSALHDVADHQFVLDTILNAKAFVKQ